MKFLWIYFVVFGLTGLVACHSRTDETVCEPTSNPFATPSTNSTDDARFAYAPNITIGRVCTFTGKVIRAQVYKHEIIKGLVFCLNPSTTWIENDGWDIVITDTTEGSNCGQGFNGIVTPPFHGMNPIFIAGWHFRNDKNTGENEGSVNAPQKVRGFNFLFNKNDFEAVWAAHSCETWNQCENGLTQVEAGKIIATMPKSGGIMTITNLELGNLIPNDKAWIESMEFEVKIYLPTE